MTKINKIIAISIGSLLVGGVIGHFTFPNVEVQEKIINKTVEVPVKETVTEIVEVPVDNGNLDEVLEAIYDNDGDIEYITEDLDEDEIDQIVDRVIFENEYKKIAKDELQKNFYGELHNQIFNTVEFDRDELSRLRIDDDIDMTDVDFEYKDAKFKLTGEITHDNVEYNFDANIIFTDGKFDEIQIISVN